MERRKSDPDPNVWKHTWVDRFFDLSLWDRAFVMGLLAALLGLALDKAAHVFGYPWMVERVFENVLEGVIIGVIVYWLGRLRQKRIERRMREIGFLNHHIRNAMHTIELAATAIADQQQRVSVIHGSVCRVVETLSKVNRESDELTMEGKHSLSAPGEPLGTQL